MDSAERVDLRCSAVIYRTDAVLLVHRSGHGTASWALPGGTPRKGESAVECVLREVAEETGLEVTTDKVALVLEASSPDGAVHTFDVVFAVSEVDATMQPVEREPGLTPHFVPLADLATLVLQPPIAGHLRSMYTHPGSGAAYLDDLWREPSADEGDSGHAAP